MTRPNSPTASGLATGAHAVIAALGLAAAATTAPAADPSQPTPATPGTTMPAATNEVAQAKDVTTSPSSPASTPDTHSPATTTPTSTMPAAPVPSTDSSPSDGRTVSTASTTTAKPGSLESFRIIYDRNIFNPNRTPRVPEREFTRREPERERRVRIESIALLGTMSYEKGDFAFFEGSSGDFRRPVRVSEQIAGFTLAAVSTAQVTLQTTNETGVTNVMLPVGMQLVRHDEGNWQMSERPASTSGYGSSSSSTSSSSSSGSSAGGGSSDVLRRLMQQREQEAGGGAPAPASTGTTPDPNSNPGSPTESAGNATQPNLNGGAPSAPAAPAAAPSGGPADDVLKRLMQRREQESK